MKVGDDVSCGADVGKIIAEEHLLEAVRAGLQSGIGEEKKVGDDGGDRAEVAIVGRDREARDVESD